MDKVLEELKAKHQINAYLMGVFEVVDNLNLKLPWGYQATWQPATHSYAETEIAQPRGSNVAESVLVGFVRVHSGDPHFPVFIYRQNTPMPWDSAKAAYILGISERRIRAIATRRNVGTKTSSGWLFTADEVELLRPGKSGRPRSAPPAGIGGQGEG